MKGRGEKRREESGVCHCASAEGDKRERENFELSAKSRGNVKKKKSDA